MSVSLPAPLPGASIVSRGIPGEGAHAGVRARAWQLYLGGLALANAALVLSRAAYWAHDDAAYTWNALRLLHGAVLYRDIAGLPPMLYWAEEVLLLLGLQPHTVAVALGILIYPALAVVATLLAARLFGRGVAVFCGCFVSLTIQTPDFGAYVAGANNGEPLLLLFSCAAMALVVDGSGFRSWRRCVGAGLLAGCALLTKQTAAVDVAAALLYLALLGFSPTARSARLGKLRAALLVGIVAAALPAAWVGYVWLHGNLAAMLFWLFTGPTLVHSLELSPLLRLAQLFVLRYSSITWLFLAVGLIVGVRRVVVGRTVAPELLPAIWLLLFLPLLVYDNDGEYFLHALIPGSLLAGRGAHIAWRYVRDGHTAAGRRAAVAGVALASLAATLFFDARALRDWHLPARQQDLASQQAVANDILRVAESNKPLLAFPYEPEFYLLTGLPSLASQAYFYGRPGEAESLCAALQAHQAGAVVVRNEPTSYLTPNAMDVVACVRADYQLSQDAGLFQVYVPPMETAGSSAVQEQGQGSVTR